MISAAMCSAEPNRMALGSDRRCGSHVVPPLALLAPCMRLAFSAAVIDVCNAIAEGDHSNCVICS